MPERTITTVKVHTVPILPEPIFLEKPVPPIMELTDPVIVINSEEAQYYADACSAYSNAGEKGFATLEEVIEEYPLTLDDACNYNIYGFTLQGWLNLESKMSEVAGYVEKLKSQIEFLENQLKVRYATYTESADNQKAAMEEDSVIRE